MLRRLLNIASILCLVLCVALMGMWVRSYWWLDTVICYRWGNWYQLDSAWGTLRATIMTNTDVGDGWFHAIKQLDANRFAFFGFGWDGSFRGPVFTAYLSHWLLALPLATLAAVPWIRPLRWRFTLRSLFTATTLLAVVLGMIAWLDHAWIGK